MNIKVLTTVCAAIYAASIGASVAQSNDENSLLLQSATQLSAKNKAFESFVRPKLSKKIKLVEGLTGSHNYIIRFVGEPIASYKGGISGYTATSPSYSNSFQKRQSVAKGNTSAKKRNSLKIDFSQNDVKRYSKYLDDKQSKFISEANNILGSSIAPIAQMKVAFNGMIVKLTQSQAVKLAKLSSVAFVEKEELLSLNTDTGPTLIGAPNVWDGTATGVGAQGEGTIIGVIDTGINTDNMSFADIGGDGYDHTNPYGANVYVGDCATGFSSLCNDKLIGVHSYPIITDVYSDAAVFGATPPAANGEDYNGHGSHTASTAGGNILLNVPMLDAQAQEEGDGVNSTGFSFPQISGVAPHANIVAFQVCWPGNTGDTYVACPNTATVQAIDDAITAGVDVINFSIGGAGAWNSSTELAFLSAQQAGIFVATSAGNSGPTPSTTKGAPWYTAVAASTHGRTVEFNKTIGSFVGGDTTVPADISGASATDGITASIVYAGDYDNPNDAAADDSAQCLAPFPAGTFSGEIVVCDRGSIARVAKAENVSSGGAGGFVLGNVQGGATTTDSDVYVIPGIHINANDADGLRAWLASGAGHTAVISGSTGVRVIGQADDMAGFSSRGPNSDVPDVMAPSIAAPGVSIYAAFADQQFGHDVTGPATTDYTFLQGTSMASPHIAGSGALLKSARPTWTADNIRSALMLTATSEMRKEDGTTPADLFDMGSGRARVDVAAQSGLLMEETGANYIAANPAIGGDPKTLNIPSMGNVSCRGACSWQRTFVATKDATWTTSASADSAQATVTVTPASFSILAGETQTITVDVAINGLRTGDQVFGTVNLTSADTTIPDANLPMFLSVNTSNIPAKIELDANRDAGSVVLRNNLALAIDEFTPNVFGLDKAAQTAGSAGQDSDTSSPFDDLTDGVAVHWLSLENASKLLYVKISDPESPDFDLFVGLDANGDGVPDPSELVCVAATFSADELCEVEDVDAGEYWIVIQNWQASAAEAVDAYTLLTASVPSVNSGNFTLSAQTSTDEFTPFDIRMSWKDDMQEGDVFVGAFEIGTDSDASNVGNLGSTIVILTRGKDDVAMSVDANQAIVGDVLSFSIDVAANLTDEDAAYSLNASIPKGLTIDPASLSSTVGEASLVVDASTGSNISWVAVREGLLGKEPSYAVTDNNTDSSCGLPNFGQGNGYLDLAGFGIGFQPTDGDTVSATFGISAPFLGQTYSTITATDDGFVTFNGNVGSTPWVNQLLPSSAAPNALVAPLWRDMQFDTASGSGLTVATAGPTYTIVEFDNMKHYAFYNGSPTVDDELDFEILINNVSGDIMFAYDNVTHNFGDLLPTTVGYENATGTFGANTVYSDGAGNTIGSVTDITSGLVICHRLIPIDTSAATITFTATVTADAAGADLVSWISSNSTNIGAEEESSSLTVSVASNLVVADIADATTAEDTLLAGIVVAYTDVDSVGNTISVTSDQGVASNITGGATGSTFDITPNQDFNGDMVVTVTVTDNEKPEDSVSTTLTVNVTPVNDAPVVASISAGLFVRDIVMSATGTDVDNDDSGLTYSWRQVDGPSVNIANANTANPSVIGGTTEKGDLTFEVTISDGALSTSKQVSVTVFGKGSGSLSWLLLLVLAGFGFRRRQ